RAGRLEGGSDPLPASALPLGMMPDAGGTEAGLTLLPGDLLVVYSDGLTEARNAADEEFGDARLRALLPSLRGVPPEQAGAAVLDKVNTFLGPEIPHDDLSIIVALRRP